MEMVVTFPGGACVDAAYGGMVIKTDQPPSGGGNGSAPTPFALFLASMGTCAGIYVLSFCQQRGLPTDEIEIRQSMEMDQMTHLVKNVRLDIHLPKDFPKKYTSALIRSAELCAVKRHLENPPKFKVETHIAE
ncbi:MAG: OsmC family protein [Anaerolineae bacterium]|nr:OsmC family protein [Anaerolineae bacterium]